MNEEVRSGTSLLATAGIDAVGFICTSGSFIDGPEGEAQLIASIRAELPSDTPVITTSHAIVDALKHLGLKRVALVTPYGDDLKRVGSGLLQRSRSRRAGLHLALRRPGR